PAVTPTAPKAPPAPAAPKPPPPPPVAASSNDRSGVLTSITAFDRNKLKKAESTPAGQRDLADLNDKQLNSLVGLLSNAMSGRRAHMKEDGDSEDDDDDDDDWE
ncbi:MAG: hypothetical protein Q8P67_09730, partial [archaeon]|nr:hypothetical protein [archaeon]